MISDINNIFNISKLHSVNLNNVSIRYTRFFISIIILMCMIVIICSTASADTITVCSSLCDHSTIQAAVDVADAGDTILVGDGIYNENINVNKSLTITSEKGTVNCIVQAADPGQA